MKNRDDAIMSALALVSHLRDNRPVWTHDVPARPGYYWVRDSKRDEAIVVDIKLDYSEREPVLVVQAGHPADQGVKYLRESYPGCQWCGPIEVPYES